ncbi:MAG TPA: Fic family protein [Candidatus Cloacimonetes bacterium]|nr:Fic family protein [Candidatus Cloacimonadota bacterium]
MAFSRTEPYNDLPLLPPNKSAFENLSIYKKLAEARSALAELKGRLPVIPNPMMLINTLVLQEARASSEIENIITTTDKMFRAFTADKKNIDPATKEVLRYREALWDSFTSKYSKMDRDVIIKIFRIITEKNEALRDGQAFIGNAYDIIYTPPIHSMVDEKLSNWFDFYHTSNAIDPLIKMAIIHYQFEAIHPFSDGNGRTGRILNVLYLTDHNLLEIPVLYISKHILEHKNKYYQLLSEVTEKNNWKDWILFMLEAVRRTSIFTLKKVNAIYAIFNEVQEKVRNKAPSIYSHELIEVLFSQPYCKNKILVDKEIASRNTASKYLNELVKLNILKIHKEGKETLYLNTQLYDVLSKN